MNYPPFLNLNSIDEYRAHFEKTYCRCPLQTFDKYIVRFKKSDFEHAFYESSRRNGIKDNFSKNRALRMDWIKYALMDSTSILKVGWDKNKKKYINKRRVAIVQKNYVIIILVTNPSKKIARFITAFVANRYTINKILQSPEWK